MRNKKVVIIALTFGFLLSTVIYAFQQPLAKEVANPFSRNFNMEANKVYSMVDEKGSVIQKTGMVIYVGDEFIAQDNKRYRVTSVQGSKAYAKFMGVEDISWDPEEEKATFSSREIPVATASPGQKVAIYYTHNDESYLPGDGTPSKNGKGGVIQVGDTFTNRLKQLGFTVVNNTTIHEPHDANAYSRSRRTAVDLLKTRPTMIVDIHRDAAPAEAYRRTINGQDVAGVKLVVGRQNPKMNANLAFAKRLKAVTDKLHPGLVTGIFMAKGDYNQDLGNRAILVEAGSYKNSKAEAQKGIALFAEAIPTALKGTGTMAQAGPVSFSPTVSESGGVFRAVLWLLGIAIIGGAIFLWVATGSIKASIQKLRQFRDVEFTNYFGPKPGLKPKDREEKDTDKENE